MRELAHCSRDTATLVPGYAGVAYAQKCLNRAKHLLFYLSNKRRAATLLHRKDDVATMLAPVEWGSSMDTSEEIDGELVTCATRASTMIGSRETGFSVQGETKAPRGSWGIYAFVVTTFTAMAGWISFLVWCVWEMV
jgi:hypothetical protein